MANELMVFADFSEVFGATALFVGGHLLLSSQNLRASMVAEIGEKFYLGLYSIFSIAALVWAAVSYGRTPVLVLWDGSFLQPAMPAIMAVAVLFWIVGVTTRSPTAVGGEGLLEHTSNPMPGILRITRHPVLWAFGLWSFTHTLALGTLAGLILFGGFALLSFLGMWHIELRRRRRLGSAWAPITMTSSVLPFAAILTGRTRMDWGGIGLWRPLAAAAVYLAALYLHGPVLGYAPVAW